MLKYFFIGFLFCIGIVSCFVYILLKYVTPALDKSNYKKSCVKVYQMCQELIQE